MRKPYAVLPVLLALLFGAVPAARAADNGNWSVYPASSELGSAAVLLSLGRPRHAPSPTRSPSPTRPRRPLTFRLYAADAYNTARDGGFAVRAPNEKQRGVGAWARPARDRVTVPAHGSVTVPYTVTVPEAAEPGDHPGALVALDERISPSTGHGGRRCPAGRRRPCVSAGERPHRARALRREHRVHPRPAAGARHRREQRADLVHPPQPRQRHPQPRGRPQGRGPLRARSAATGT